MDTEALLHTHAHTHTHARARARGVGVCGFDFVSILYNGDMFHWLRDTHTHTKSRRPTHRNRWQCS